MNLNKILCLVALLLVASMAFATLQNAQISYVTAADAVAGAASAKIYVYFETDQTVETGITLTFPAGFTIAAGAAGDVADGQGGGAGTMSINGTSNAWVTAAGAAGQTITLTVNSGGGTADLTDWAGTTTGQMSPVYLVLSQGANNMITNHASAGTYNVTLGLTVDGTTAICPISVGATGVTDAWASTAAGQPTEVTMANINITAGGPWTNQSFTLDFSAFGTDEMGIQLDESLTILDFGFSGFTTNPTNVTVNNTAKTMTFAGGSWANSTNLGISSINVTNPKAFKREQAVKVTISGYTFNTIAGAATLTKAYDIGTAATFAKATVIAPTAGGTNVDMDDDATADFNFKTFHIDNEFDNVGIDFTSIQITGDVAANDYLVIHFPPEFDISAVTANDIYIEGSTEATPDFDDDAVVDFQWTGIFEDGDVDVANNEIFIKASAALLAANDDGAEFNKIFIRNANIQNPNVTANANYTLYWYIADADKSVQEGAHALSATTIYTAPTASFTDPAGDDDATSLYGLYDAVTYTLGTATNGTGDDDEWTLWAHTNSGLDRVNSTTGAIMLTSYGTNTGDKTASANFSDGEPLSDIDQASTGVNFTCSTLPEGDWYLYLVKDDAGDYRRAVSGKLTVQHKPAVSPLDPSIVEYLDSSGRLYGAATGSGAAHPNNTDIHFDFHNYKDDAANVKLYYSSASTYAAATPAVNTTYWSAAGPDSTISSNLTEIGSFTNYARGTHILTQNWAIANSSTVLVPAGNYYIYALAYRDSSDYSVVRSSNVYTVQHRANINLSYPIGPNTITTPTQQYLMIAWQGDNGDVDLDSDANIYLFYDDTDWDPSDAANYATNKTALQAAINQGTDNADEILIASGISENLETNEYSDMYAWDLWNTNHSGSITTGGYIYAYITDGDITGADPDGYFTRHDLASTITFTHVPSQANPGVTFYKPVPIPGTKSNGITVNKGELVDIDFEINQLGTAEEWILVASTIAAAPADGSGFDADGDGASGDVDTWIINTTVSGLADTDGAGTLIAPEKVSQTPPYLLTRDDNSFTWNTGLGYTTADGTTLSSGPLANGEYYLYLVLDDDGDGELENEVIDIVVQCPGTVQLVQCDATWDEPDVKVTPSVISVSKGATTDFEFIMDSDGKLVDQIALYFQVDAELFELVDQDDNDVSDTTGIQPLDLYDASGQFASNWAIAENTAILNQSTNKYEVAFVAYYFNNMTAPTGDVMATMQLECRGTSNANGEDFNIVYDFDDDNGRMTALFNDGIQIGNAQFMHPLIHGYVLPRAKVMGQVPLETRITGSGSYAEEITFALREVGAFASYNDTYFAAANDGDTNEPDIQYSTNAQGEFVLTDVPQGTYDLVAIADGFLRGKNRITVRDGYIYANQNPTENNSGIDQEVLLAGDADGNNRVNLSDPAVLIARWGWESSDSEWQADATVCARADFNDDNVIDVTDLQAVSKNYNVNGVIPFHNAEEPEMNEQNFIAMDAPTIVMPGQTIAVPVYFQNFNDVSGYEIWMNYDVNTLAFDRFESAIFDDMGTTFMYPIAQDGRLILTETLNGPTRGFAGSEGLLGTAYFTGKAKANVMIQLAGGKLVNSAFHTDKVNVDRIPVVNVENVVLSQNYPNPFNPETQISFSIPQTSNVELTIYNIKGRKVKTLVNSIMDSGLHTVRWNGQNGQGESVASGVYFYRLTADGVVSTKKMMLLK